MNNFLDATRRMASRKHMDTIYPANAGNPDLVRLAVMPFVRVILQDFSGFMRFKPLVGLAAIKYIISEVMPSSGECKQVHGKAGLALRILPHSIIHQIPLSHDHKPILLRLGGNSALKSTL